MKKLTLEALEVLDAIDRKGSYAAAAASLYKVQSKVSYTVNKLEEDIGVPLFKKQGRKSVLTPAGRVLLEQGRELLEAAERLVENTRQVGRGWGSCLNIAVDSILELSILYPLLDQFYDLQPDVEINLYEEVLGGSWEAVIEGRADIVVGAPEPPLNTNGLQIEKLSDVEWLFVAAGNHPLTSVKQPLTEQVIRQHRAVVVRDSSRQLPPLTRRVFDQQARLVVPTLQQKINAQLIGMGVGFLPKFRIETYLKSGKLVALQLLEAESVSPLHIAWKKGNNGKALCWFAERLPALTPLLRSSDPFISSN